MEQEGSLHLRLWFVVSCGMNNGRGLVDDGYGIGRDGEGLRVFGCDVNFSTTDYQAIDGARGFNKGVQPLEDKFKSRETTKVRSPRVQLAHLYLHARETAKTSLKYPQHIERGLDSKTMVGNLVYLKDVHRGIYDLDQGPLRQCR